jgi:hypothetical protein
VLWLGIITTAAAFVAFAVTTLIHEPASMITLIVVVALSFGLDFWWRNRRDTATPTSGAPVPV